MDRTVIKAAAVVVPLLIVLAVRAAGGLLDFRLFAIPGYTLAIWLARQFGSRAAVYTVAGLAALLLVESLRPTTTQGLVEASISCGLLGFCTYLFAGPGRQSFVPEPEYGPTPESLLDSTAEGILGVDEQGRCTFANAAAAYLTGCASRDDLLGRRVDDLIASAIPDGSRGGDDTNESSGLHALTPDDSQFLLRREDGSTLPVECLAHRVVRGGRWRGSVVTFYDITDRLKNEAALRETQERQELAIRGAELGVWDWDPQTDETDFNDRWFTMLGYEPDELPNRLETWAELMHPEDAERVNDLLQAHLSGQTDEYQPEFRLKRKGGGWVWILSCGKVITRDNDGKPRRVCGMHLDITARKEIERVRARLLEELQVANAALEQSNAELQQFAYVASHDLQTPLRAILVFSHFLADDYADRLDETGRDHLDRVLESAARMKKLIEDLLLFSRVETEGVALAPVEFDDVMADAARFLQPYLEETEAQLICDSLPQVLGDRAQLLLLMENLIGNAIKYNESDRPTVRVAGERASTKDGNRAIIRVSDNGIGIDPKYGDEVFDVFRRLHTHEEYPGTGIGLAVCRRIVKRHGGTISYASEPGSGTTFTIELPAGD